MFRMHRIAMIGVGSGCAAHGRNCVSASQWLGFSLALIPEAIKKSCKAREYVHIHACVVGSVLNDEFFSHGH
jgi:hypothetical protein